jgi:hypothetical protein
MMKWLDATYLHFAFDEHERRLVVAEDGRT